MYYVNVLYVTVGFLRFYYKIDFKLHICGEKYCTNCDVYHSDDDHRCFIKTLPKAEIKKDLEIWAF